MRQNPSWISDFNWCIDNDWQVYIIPGTYKDHRIGVRKGGISSHGKDYRRVKLLEAKHIKHRKMQWKG